MFRLSLLGGLSLEGPEGLLCGRVAQRRQLALLTLLAAAPQGSLRRDKVVAWLWPDSGEDRARHSLSDTLYVIRDALGERSIENRGDELRLDPSVVTCDLWDFCSALEDGDLDRAVDLYAGPFLEGTHLEGSEDLERWVADERAWLEQRAGEAALERAGELRCEGDLSGAERRARAALRIDPTNEAGLRCLLRIRDERGDRAGAIRAYEKFARRLATDLDVEPAPETEALVAEIRAREVENGLVSRAGAEGPASSDAAPAPAGRASLDRPRIRRWLLPTAAGIGAIAGAFWLSSILLPGGPVAVTTEESSYSVAVLPFEVQGEGLDLWREGMVDLVSTNLDILSEVRAVPSQTVLARWRETAIDGPPDLETLLNVARRTQADYAISGSVVGTGDRLRVHGQLFDLRDGARLGEAVAVGPPDSVFTIVDRLSLRLMAPLLTARSRGGDRLGLASVTTSSGSALQAFLEGEAFFRSGEYERAVGAYRRAVEADSTFALAHCRLAEAYGWTSEPGLGDVLEEAKLAARYSDRLPGRKARAVQAALAYLDGDPEVLKIVRRTVRMYPDDPEAWMALGDAYFHFGGLELVRPWEFVDALERSIELDPAYAPAYEHLIHAAFLRDPDSVRIEWLFELQARAGGVADRHRVAFELAFGDPRSRREALARLGELSPSELHAMASLYFSHPRFLELRERALRAARDRLSPDVQDQNQGIQWSLFSTLLWRGRLDEALEAVEDPALDHARATALLEARAAGYPIPDGALARALRSAPGPVDRLTESPVIFELAADAADRGDWRAHARAVERLRSLIPRIGAESEMDRRRVRGLIEALEGYAAWRRGDLEEALGRLRTARSFTFALFGPRDLLMRGRNRIIRWWLAELHSEMGQWQDASVLYASLGPGEPDRQNPMAYYRLGGVRDRFGDRDGARRAYELAAMAWRNPDPWLQPLAETARTEAAR